MATMIYREVIVRNHTIIWANSQMYSTKEGVREAIDLRANEMTKLNNGKVEDFKFHPWDSCEIKEGEHTTFLTVERRKVVINGRNDSLILGFVTYELK